MAQQLGHFFLNIDNDVGFLQFFLQSLILATQLIVLTGQRIALGLRTRFCEKALCTALSRSLRHPCNVEE